MKRLINKTKHVYVLGLGPHIANGLSNHVADLNRSISTDYIIPIFPIDHPSTRSSREKGFVMQGSIDDSRRNYRGILADINYKKDAIPPEFQLIILGNGSCALPEGIRSVVRLRQNEKFPEYYGVIQNNSALLTAFASEVYYTEKASSSVAASLMCRTPLLTTTETFRTYSYLSSSSVWLQNSTESELEAMLRILKTPNFPVALEQRVLSLNQDFQRAIDRNVKLAVKIVQIITANSSKL